MEQAILICRWREVFETAESRKLKRLTFFSPPSGVDSAGYLELMTEHGEAGVIALGVFQAMCQVTATFPPERRGRFVKSTGKPMSVRQIAALIRIPEATVEAALRLLESEEIQWITRENPTDLPPISHRSPTDLPTESHRSPNGIPTESQKNPANLGIEYIEGEENRGEEIVPPLPPPSEGGDAPAIREKLASLFGREPGDAWTDKERSAIGKLEPIPEADAHLIASYYRADIEKREDCRRKSLLALLRNWQTELDRARRRKGVKTEAKKGNGKPPDDFAGWLAANGYSCPPSQSAWNTLKGEYRATVPD